MSSDKTSLYNGHVDYTIDLHYLRETSMRNKAYVENVCKIFREQTPVLIEELSKEMNSSDYEKISLISNQIKHHFNVLGITKKSDIFERLDKHKSTLPKSLAERYTAQLKKIWLKAIDELAMYGY